MHLLPASSRGAQGPGLWPQRLPHFQNIVTPLILTSLKPCMETTIPLCRGRNKSKVAPVPDPGWQQGLSPRGRAPHLS